MCTTHGDVRLIGDKSPGSGVVQICSYGVWRTLCSHYAYFKYCRQFDQVAQVVCSQLGFNTKCIQPIFLALYIYASCSIGVSIFHDGRYHDHILPLVRTGSVTCNGSESNISYCKLSSCSSECNGYDDIGIKCDYSKRYTNSICA